MKVEYELDQWEWQGTTHSIEIDPWDYRGMDAEEMKRQVHREIRRDAESRLHLVYEEDNIARDIAEALREAEESEDDDE